MLPRINLGESDCAERSAKGNHPHCPYRAEVQSVQKASATGTSQHILASVFHNASEVYLLGLNIIFFREKMYFTIHLIQKKSDIYSVFQSDCAERSAKGNRIHFSVY